MQKEEAKKQIRVQDRLIKNKIIKNTVESKFELDLIDGTEAYYSERYGWTLRKSK